MQIDRVTLTWHKVTLGVHKSPDAYRRALAQQGCKVAAGADEMLSQVSVSDVEQEMRLLILPVVGFGLGSATYEEICTKAKDLGLLLCPAEAGPALALTLRQAGRSGWFYLGMEPIQCCRAGAGIFSYGSDHTLAAFDTQCGFRWGAGALFVFVQLTRF